MQRTLIRFWILVLNNYIGDTTYSPFIMHRGFQGQVKKGLGLLFTNITPISYSLV